jgi:hypothetical protein
MDDTLKKKIDDFERLAAGMLREEGCLRFLAREGPRKSEGKNE